jgi:Skp family chaperone for outer membrane proteins
MKTILAALAAVLLLTAPVRAIQLSLEENRAESGSVGFVDMQRLFDSSPDASRAKESFQDLIRQAEERVNLRKAEILKLRRELDDSRAARAALAASTETVPAPPAPAPAPAPVPAAATVSTATAANAPAPALSTAAIALPGMTEEAAAPAAPPSASTATDDAGLKSLLQPAVAASTATAAAPSAAAPPAAPQTGKAERLLTLDAKILALQAEIASKETELAKVHDDADKDLLAAEGRKTDRVLARLYRAIGTVAKREGVSVVIDKSSLLYGHPAMDLTDKVLAELSRSAP